MQNRSSELVYDTIEPGAVGNFYTEFALAALADGYGQVPGGVWGIQQQPHEYVEELRRYRSTGERHDGDRTIHLRRDDVSIYLVDRDIRLRDGNLRRETWTSAWTENGTRSINVPDEYSAEAIEAERGVCSHCKRPGDQQRLRHFRFAEKLCPDCDTPQRRAAGEFDGWCD